MSNAEGQLGPVMPVEALGRATGLILLGGSFDPPHAWHTKIARAARDAVFGGGGWVLFIPAARSPLKGRGPIAPAADRVAMLRLAVADTPNAAVWTDEIDRAERAAGGPGGPSYTIYTVERLRSLSPRVPMRLLIGMDQAEQFHKWRRYRELMELAEPVVVYRGFVHQRRQMRAALAATGAWTVEELDAWDRRLVPCEVSAVSSTWVREALANPSADEGPLRGLIKKDVLDYIRAKGLYRAE